MILLFSYYFQSVTTQLQLRQRTRQCQEYSSKMDHDSLKQKLLTMTILNLKGFLTVLGPLKLHLFAI